MRRTNYFPYIFLSVFLFFLMSLSQNASDGLRNFAVSSVSPIWSKFYFAEASHFKIEKNNFPNLKDFKKMELENELLKTQAENFYEFLNFDQKIEEQFERFKQLSENNTDDIYWNDFFRRRAEETKKILKVNLQAVPARIIFRDPTSWSSSVWINIGHKQNESLGKPVISKNSAVVLGKNLIGLVEYVGYKNSRVRLITDAGLVPSVRAIRGSTQDRALLSIVRALKDHVHARDDLFEEDQKQSFLNDLFQLSQKLTQNNEDKYLAKGELHGSSLPLFRSKGQVLKGVGFNYDYADIEGAQRDLRKGNVLQDNIQIKTDPLLKKGDLLVTTGMDGIFPANLHVGIVSKVEDLQDGDFAYEIEAKPMVSNLNELEFVFVMPSLDFQEK
ncbi:MAG: hypothetical protein JXA94_06615 [Parachlamydiales bacterium]|nr:hypothetical protein [Parachlamydiales bacterium]